LPARPVVLALPRGGVPVGAPIADRLTAPLEVIMVRKIGAPFRPELAMGALALVGEEVSTFRNEEVIRPLGIDDEVFEAAYARELAEARRRQAAFGGGDQIQLENADVIMVDDGLATGSTMHAAVAAVRRLHPATITVAVPVGSRPAVAAMHQVADRVVCALVPRRFLAVGGAYADFTQLTDRDVQDLLARPTS
jgi:putative phosphoribosyl transferase